MKKYDYSMYKDDEHVCHNWTPLHFTITENYSYVSENFFFNLFSDVFFQFVFFLIRIFNYLVYDFKIIDREKLLVKSGAITISNHVHYMDCTMIACACAPFRVYFPTLEANFRIPFISDIIKLLYAVPIPENNQFKPQFYESMNKVLANNKKIHMYPEGSMWPYYDGVRSFKYGAFKMAVENNVPIIPIKFVFVDSKRFYKKKKAIRAIITDPLYPNSMLSKKEAIEDLKNRCYEVMKGTNL